MIETTSMRDPDVPPKSRRPVRATALALVAVTGGLFLLWRERQGPERLAEFPPGRQSYPAGVVGEELFVRHNDPARTTLDIRAMPLRGGPERPVFRVENVNDFVSTVDGRIATFTRTGIYYATRDATRDMSLPPPEPPGGPRPVPLRQFPPQPPTHRTWERRPRMRMWHVPLAGGTPRELFAERPSYSKMVVGDYCYWLESELLGTGKPLVTKIEERPKQKLRVAPLSGGAPRTIAELPLDARVMPGTRGVFWTSDRGRLSDLVYARPPEFSLAVISDVHGFEAPREVGDRVYWLDGAGKEDANGFKQLHQLVSTAADGGDRRVDLDVAQKSSGETIIYGLVDDGATLLFQQARTRTAGGDAIPKRESGLFYFGVERKELRPLVHWQPEQTPPGLMIDGGYAYYAVIERRENWLDWSAKGLSPRPVLQLSRVRLPR